jgi:orotate phosphoribosyltransferase
VLTVLAGVTGLVYPIFFRPLLAGFLSHSLLDIFLFDNSKGTIRQIIDIAITNDTAASQINETVVTGVAAEGIMLLYPISRKMYYILLSEQTYAIVVVLVLCTAAVTLYLTRSNKGNYR